MEKFVTMIAFQLCTYDKEFSQAIGNVLTQESGIAMISKEPLEQLRAFIMEPLWDILKSQDQPIVVIDDALDECNDQDVPLVLSLLCHLVQQLLSFNVIATTPLICIFQPTSSTTKLFIHKTMKRRV
jgi:hypothetical protein